MMPLKVVLSYAAAGAALLGFAAWRLRTDPPAVPVAGVLVDRSGSKLKPCLALAGVAERVVASPPAELSVFLTGDADTADAPELMLLPPVPQHERLIKGRGRQLAQCKAFVRELAARCDEDGTRQTSPIFEGIQQALAHLRAEPGRGRRTLHAITDLRETQEPRITAALAQLPGTKAKLPIINNAGITISICGYLESTRKKEPSGGQRPPQVERVLEVWQRVFSDPARVSFKPYCPPPATSMEE